jgi:hypothetical protein
LRYWSKFCQQRQSGTGQIWAKNQKLSAMGLALVTEVQWGGGRGAEFVWWRLGCSWRNTEEGWLWGWVLGVATVMTNVFKTMELVC